MKIPEEPRGHVTDGNLQDGSSFGHVSFMVWYYQDFCHVIVAVWWFQVLVWLGVFWLFSATNNSGIKTKNVSHKSCPQICIMRARAIHTSSSQRSGREGIFCRHRSNSCFRLGTDFCLVKPFLGTRKVSAAVCPKNMATSAYCCVRQLAVLWSSRTHSWSCGQFSATMVWNQRDLISGKNGNSAWLWKLISNDFHVWFSMHQLWGATKLWKTDKQLYAQQSHVSSCFPLTFPPILLQLPEVSNWFCSASLRLCRELWEKTERIDTEDGTRWNVSSRNLAWLIPMERKSSTIGNPQGSEAEHNQQTFCSLI